MIPHPPIRTRFLRDKFCSCWTIVSVLVVITSTSVSRVSTVSIAPAADRCNVPLVGDVMHSRGPGPHPCRRTVLAHESVVPVVSDIAFVAH